MGKKSLMVHLSYMIIFGLFAFASHMALYAQNLPAQATAPSVESTANATPPELGNGQNKAEIPAGASDSITEEDRQLGLVKENEFAGTPYVIGGRRVMALNEAPEFYKIEPGDTLYDICDQLIDEPDYWPKLWALNPGIKNPHFVFPGMVITFYPGDDATPPFLQVLNEDEVLPIQWEGLKETDLIAQADSDIPNEQSPDAQLIASKNANFFAHAKTDGTDFLTDDFEQMGEVFIPSSRQMELPVLISQEELTERGTVIAGPSGEVLIPESQRVVIEIEDSSLQPGSYITFVRASGKIYDGENDKLGYRYEYVAQARIVYVDASSETAVADVLRSRLGVRPDDIAIDFRSTARNFDQTASAIENGRADMTVVGFEYPSQTMAGQGQVVIIDKSVNVGATLPVYQNFSTRVPRMLRVAVPNVVTNIGLIKIIESNSNSSIGIVLQNTMNIRSGDKLGKG